MKKVEDNSLSVVKGYEQVPMVKHSNSIIDFEIVYDEIWNSVASDQFDRLIKVAITQFESPVNYDITIVEYIIDILK